MDVATGLLSFSMAGGGGLFKTCCSGSMTADRDYAQRTFENPQICCFVFASYYIGSSSEITYKNGVLVPGGILDIEHWNVVSLAADGLTITAGGSYVRGVQCSYISFGS